MIHPIVIVGGGPAGLAAAIFLAENKVPVIIADKQHWPIDKTCGEGIMPAGVNILEQLGVLREIRDSFPLRGIGYVDDSGISVSSRFASGEGLGIRRVVLSKALQRIAIQKGVTLLPGTALQNLEVRDKAMRLNFRQPSGTLELDASLVIGADGFRSTVRRLMGMSGTPPLRQKRWGARRHFLIEPWSDMVEVHWQAGMEAYLTPVGSGTMQVTFLWDKSRFRPEGGRESFFKTLFDSFPELAQRFRGASALDPVTVTGPMATAARLAGNGRILLIGDALGFTDGITGEGISTALRQAAFLGKTLPALRHDGKFNPPDLQPLARQLEQIFTKSYRWTGIAMLLTRHQRLRKRIIGGFSRSPEIFQQVLESNIGRSHPLKIPPSALPAFLRGFLSPVHYHPENPDKHHQMTAPSPGQ